MSDYRIIDCDLHDRYEIAALRGRRLLLSWLDDTGAIRREVVTPDNLVTTAEGEFLIGTAGCARPVRIRLDRIAQARDIEARRDFPRPR